MTNDVRNTTTITTPSDTTIRIEREFDAPRELVWEAYTDPESMAYWLGPRGTEMKIEESDLRPGGKYRWTAAGEGDSGMVFFGEFRQVDPPKLLESTFAYEGMDGEPSVDHLELEELEGGRTRLVAISTFASKEQRDGMLQSGMEKGVVEGYEKLDELLAQRQS